MQKLALIDGDTIAYRCAASCEPNKTFPDKKEPLGFATARAEVLIRRALNSCQTTEFRIFLSGTRNFRKDIYPDYKAHRRSPPPRHLEGVREYLIREWGAEVCDGYEADDGISMAAAAVAPEFVICANDKDFLQIAGEHYNPVKHEFQMVDEETATRNFYTQMLVGDASDNVGGVPGIGPVKAQRILEGCPTEELHSRVRSCYADDERFFLTLHLLRLLRSEDELEDILSESQRQEPTEDSSEEDIGDLSGANEE